MMLNDLTLVRAAAESRPTCWWGSTEHRQAVVYPFLFTFEVPAGSAYRKAVLRVSCQANAGEPSRYHTPADKESKEIYRLLGIERFNIHSDLYGFRCEVLGSDDADEVRAQGQALLCLSRLLDSSTRHKPMKRWLLKQLRQYVAQEEVAV